MPDALLYSHPVSGCTSSMTYSSPCTSLEATRCQAGIGSSAGGGCVKGQKDRRSIRASTVTPSHLCQLKTLSLSGLETISGIDQPQDEAVITSAAPTPVRAAAV